MYSGLPRLQDPSNTADGLQVAPGLNGGNQDRYGIGQSVMALPTSGPICVSMNVIESGKISYFRLARNCSRLFKLMGIENEYFSSVIKNICKCSFNGDTCVGLPICEERVLYFPKYILTRGLGPFSSSSTNEETNGQLAKDITL